MGEIVVGVNIFQEMALFQIPHARGCPARVQCVGDLVGARIEFVIVHALVDAHTPQYDAGVIAVLQQHLPQHGAGAVFPCPIADVLPAGQLGKYKQAQPVTFIKEILALRVMARAHRITVQLVFQDAGVLPLQAFRRGVANVGIALVAVQPAQKGLFPVQIKAVRPEHSRPETEGGFPAVQYLPIGIEQLCYAAVEIRMLGVPRCGIRQRKAAFRRFCQGQLAAHQRLARTAAEPDAQRSGLFRCFYGQLYGSFGQRRCVHEKIAHTALRRGFKPDLPV